MHLSNHVFFFALSSDCILDTIPSGEKKNHHCFSYFCECRRRLQEESSHQIQELEEEVQSLQARVVTLKKSQDDVQEWKKTTKEKVCTFFSVFVFFFEWAEEIISPHPKPLLQIQSEFTVMLEQKTTEIRQFQVMRGEKKCLSLSLSKKNTLRI